MKARIKYRKLTLQELETLHEKHMNRAFRSTTKRATAKHSKRAAMFSMLWSEKKLDGASLADWFRHDTLET